MESEFELLKSKIAKQKANQKIASQKYYQAHKDIMIKKSTDYKIKHKINNIILELKPKQLKKKK